MAYNADSDRRSAVSSFYGGRRGSNDVLGPGMGRATPETGSYAPHERHDSSSSYYNSGRPSNDRLTGSAGYNKDSYFAQGREEPIRGGRDEEDPGSPEQDEGWDVYADFNNQGPRYSTLMTSGNPELAASTFGNNHSGYHQLPPSNASLKKETDAGSMNAGNVELVTVPALGAEWNAAEMAGMKKSTKREAKRDARAHHFKQWWRDEEGLCGGFMKRRTLVYFVFALCIAVGITLAVTIPRVPAFSVNSQTPIAPPQNVTGVTLPPNEFSRTPANFSFPASVSLEMDTTSNLLPLHFTHLRASIYDLNTLAKVAEGDWGDHMVPAKQFVPISIPVFFNYTAVNDTDITWLDFYNACRNSDQYPNGTRPGFDIRLILEMNIVGLVHTTGDSTQVTNIACPFELPTNSV